MHELLRDEVALLARGERELLDLPGDALLLVERELDGGDDVRELDLRRLDGGDDDLLVRVEEVLHHHHRVVPLLERLAVEVRGELRQRLRVVVDGDRDVLLRGAELVRDLLVESAGELRAIERDSRRSASGRAPLRAPRDVRPASASRSLARSARRRAE